MSGPKLTGIAASLGSLQHLRKGPQAVLPAVSAESLSTYIPASPVVQAGTAKRANPDYVQLKAYVLGTTKKAAMRKAEDEGLEDFSALIQQLLDEYLSS